MKRIKDGSCACGMKTYRVYDDDFDYGKKKKVRKSLKKSKRKIRKKSKKRSKRRSH